MINKVPDSWEYNESMEMLYMFYQLTDELLSELTPDTYSLPLHNTLTLVFEIKEVFELIKKLDVIGEHYKNYIPPIIDELLASSEKDYIFKRYLGNRLDSIRTGLKESKDNPILLERWINLIIQSCDLSKYLSSYKEELENIITTTTNKNDLIYCTKNYYITLLKIGYTREHIYLTAKRFFDNKLNSIDNPAKIVDYLKEFDEKQSNYKFLALMDIGTIEYFETIHDALEIKIEIISPRERIELSQDDRVKNLFSEYDKVKNNGKKNEKMSVVKFELVALDPYIAANRVIAEIRKLQTFTRYFKHFPSHKQVFKLLVKSEYGYYRELRIPNKMNKRPFISQKTIDERISNIFKKQSMGASAIESLTQAISMHAEAFDSKDLTTLFRTFWTATETLFANPSSKTERDNVFNSVLAVIQKTYLLKTLRGLYFQLLNAIDDQQLKEIGIENFEAFVKYFSSHEESSAEMKKIYTFLSINPLLRSRLYQLRKLLKNSNKISDFIKVHNERIMWQLKRIYRSRNMATHLGYQVEGLDVIANHLHNYFDYVVNYMLCKSENGDYIENTSSLVFEAKVDNMIHHEILKRKEPLTSENYLDFLFGPDPNIIKYQFEF